MTDLEIDIPDLIAHDDAYNTRGKEWAGPCPSCGGDDRCVITPPTSPRVGDRALWWCRQCRLGGDVVTWLEHSQHLTRAEAMREVGLSTDMDDTKKGVVRRRKREQERKQAEADRHYEEQLAEEYRRTDLKRALPYLTPEEQDIAEFWYYDKLGMGPRRHDPPAQKIHPVEELFYKDLVGDYEQYKELRTRMVDRYIRIAHDRARAEEEAVRRAECGSTADL